MLENTRSSGAPEHTVSEAVASLQAELSADANQHKEQSYTGRVLSSASSLFDRSGDTETGVSNLLAEIQASQKKGDHAQAEKLSAQADQVLAVDQKAQKINAGVANYGGEFVGVASMFTGGKTGLVTSALAFAANAAKPDDTITQQLTEAGLGAAQGLVMKGSLDGLAATKINIAGKAVLTSEVSRVSQIAFNKDTYVDPASGKVDLAGGLNKVGAGLLDMRALASDAVIYGVAGLALGKLDSASGGLLTRSRVAGGMAAGSVFGFASGSADEIQRQEKAGSGFNLGSVLESGAAHAGVDGLAGAAGSAVRFSGGAVETAAKTSTEPVIENPAAPQKGAPSVTWSSEAHLDSRTFVITSAGKSPESAVSYLQSSPDAFDLLKVREVNNDGKVDSRDQTMLIQHLDQQTPLRTGLANSADLIATCNPDLTGDLIGKHIFPDANGAVTITADGGTLRFTGSSHDSGLENASGANGAANEILPSANSVELRHVSVSDVLRSRDTFNKIRVMEGRDLDAIAKSMREFNQPVKRFVDGGGDSLVFEMTNGNILKITDRPWREEWGHRQYHDENGNLQDMDAPLLTDPRTITTGKRTARYYEQPKAQTPVRMSDLQQFKTNLLNDGEYRAWDMDEDIFGRHQLGYLTRPDGTRGVYLLDYNAVKPFDEVSDDEPSSRSVPSWRRKDYIW